MQQPPKFLLKLFRSYCHPRLVKPIEGDLLELYEERVKEKGKFMANLLFAKDVLLLIRREIIKPVEGSTRLNYYGILKHNLKTGYRSLLRDKGHSFLNIMGLAIGMAVCMVIISNWS